MTRPALLRSTILHTPRNPFREAAALEYFSDGGMLIEDGRITGIGDYKAVRRMNPLAETRDLRGGFLVPGFVDTHVHFPQVRVMGSLGASLLEWLTRFALPEEARMADTAYADVIAGEFLHGMASHGTTTALVFGSHFTPATEILFERAAKSGLRVITGLVMADRGLLPELHLDAEAAYRESTALIAKFHGVGRLSYAVTPRFAVSTSDAMLEVCGALLREHPGVRFQTHINETVDEIAEVTRLFPWASDYLGVYEQYGVLGDRTVLAHNVHGSNDELARMAAFGAAVAHCPCSNASLGSGIFPMRRHVAADVRFGLGTDVGAGTGFGILKEGLQAYLLQRLSADGYPLTAVHLLYLATLAGADALGMAAETGDFRVGKSADFVYLRSPVGSPLEAAVRRSEDPESLLGALFTLGGSESVHEVRVGGEVVYGG